MTHKDESVCRGSIYLGSQCGSCSRCKAEIKKLLDRDAALIALVGEAYCEGWTEGNGHMALSRQESQAAAYMGWNNSKAIEALERIRS